MCVRILIRSLDCDSFITRNWSLGDWGLLIWNVRNLHYALGSWPVTSVLEWLWWFGLDKHRLTLKPRLRDRLKLNWSDRLSVALSSLGSLRLVEWILVIEISDKIQPHQLQLVKVCLALKKGLFNSLTLSFAKMVDIFRLSKLLARFHRTGYLIWAG